MTNTICIGNPNGIISIVIETIYRRIATISEQTSVHCNVRIDKTLYAWIIIPTPQIVQPRLLIKHIPAIPKRLHLAQRLRQLTSAPQRRAPRIVAVADDGIAILIQNRNNIAGQG